MAFIAIMAGKRRAVLLQHVFDEEGWRMVVKIWKVPKSQTSPEGIDYSLALISPEGERWWDTIITGRKDTIVMYWDEKARTPIAELTV